MWRAIQKLLVFSIIFILSACNSDSRDTAYYTDEVSKLNSKQAIEYYVNAWNEKNFTKMNAVLSDGIKAITVDYDSVKSAKVTLLEAASVAELPSTVNSLHEVNVYKVVLEIKRKRNTELQDEKETAYYYVGKEKANSLWLIFDVREVK